MDINDKKLQEIEILQQKINVLKEKYMEEFEKHPKDSELITHLSMVLNFPEENPNPILRISLDGKVFYFNEPSKEILFYWKIRKGLITEEKILQILRKIRDFKKGIIFDETIEEKTFSFTFSYIPEMNYVNIYGMDITDREKNLHQLQDSLKEITLLSKFPEENPNPVMRVTTDGQMVFYNPASKNLRESWEVSSDCIQSKEILTILQHLDHESNKVSAKLCVDEITWAVSFRKLEGTKFVNIYAFDISEQEHATNEMIKARNRYYNLFNNMIDGYALHKIIVDDAGKPIDYEYIDINPSFSKLTGLSREMVIGKRVTEIIPEIEKDSFNWIGKYGEVALKRKNTSFESYSEALGKHFAISAYYTEPLHFVTVFQDISERIKIKNQMILLNEELERRVQERTAKLAAVNKELESFSYSVSHDLRSPLRSIDGFSQAILEDYANVLDDVGKDYLRRVRSGVQRMGELISDILKLSRLTRAKINLSLVNLSEVVTNKISDLQNSTPSREIEFTIQPNIHTKCDLQLMEVVIQNLLENAVKFTSKIPHPKISFGQRVENGKEVYFVQDNGAGFDMRYYEKLFGPFQRLHSSQEFEGTGIGLATVQRIIQKHGGNTWARGKVGEGAIFYFTLS